jgi:hypothetical protein
LKKTTKPAGKKPAQKKPAAKKTSSTKPKRKAQDQGELTQVVARLEAVADKLAEAVKRLATGTTPLVETRKDNITSIMAAARYRPGIGRGAAHG